MSFKVKDLAMNVGAFNVNEASTCSTWTRVSGGNSGICGVSASPFAGGESHLAALRAQLRQAVSRV
ncbi:MAG: hypothetical protein ABUT39_28505 [Acidobacteriota bacterium]